jgi:hypothetical protein
MTPPTLGYANPMPLAPLGELFRDGPRIVVRNGAALPGRCILCGADAATPPTPPVALSFTWDPSFRITRVLTLQLRQHGHIDAHLCGGHLARYRRYRRFGGAGMIAATVIMLGGLALALVSELSDVPRYTPLGIAALFTGFALFIVLSFLFTIGTRTLACTRIENDYLYLEGAAEAFLAPLPPLPPQPPTA